MLMLCCLRIASAQEVALKLSNNVSSFPVLGTGELFSAPIHPGVALSYTHHWVDRGRHHWLPNADINYVYHRMFQSSVALNVGIDYRLDLAAGWSMQAGLSGGYLHSYYHYDRFKLENGRYQKIASWKGKSQFDVGFDLSVIKKLNTQLPLSITLEYAPYVHGTFAKSYVPVVPYNSLGIGLIYHLQPAKQESI